MAYYTTPIFFYGPFAAPPVAIIYNRFSTKKEDNTARLGGQL
jgi:hypothetical protein